VLPRHARWLAGTDTPNPMGEDGGYVQRHRAPRHRGLNAEVNTYSRKAAILHTFGPTYAQESPARRSMQPPL
jgi:hypothetical protein